MAAEAEAAREARAKVKKNTPLLNKWTLPGVWIIEMLDEFIARNGGVS